MNADGAQLFMVNVDCSDPQSSAAFYGAVLDWDIVYSDGDYSMISNGAVSLGFGRIEGYRPPDWPDTSHVKRYHLDVQVPDLSEALAECQALGAQVPDFQPGGNRWTIALDPEGRPFCLFPKRDEESDPQAS